MPSSIGSLTGVFSGDITFDWYPEPVVLANELRAMAGALDDMLPPLEESREIASRDIAERFATKTDPSGAAWAAWSPNYKGNDLMILSGALAGAAPEALDINAYPGGGEVVFTGDIPEYGFFHQFGAVRSRGGTLPQRAFIGLTDEAQGEVVIVFDSWIETIIEAGI